jgi:hypothetical protein
MAAKHWNVADATDHFLFEKKKEGGGGGEGQCINKHTSSDND